MIEELRDDRENYGNKDLNQVMINSRPKITYSGMEVTIIGESLLMQNTYLFLMIFSLLPH